MNEHGFIPFCKHNEKEILDLLVCACGNIPTKMNSLDYRYHISGLVCHALAKRYNLGGEGATISASYKVGYDLLFSETIKISVKILKKMFHEDTADKVHKIIEKLNKEEIKRLGIKISKPPEIVLKNTLSSSVTNAQESTNRLPFDFLLTVQRGDPNKHKTVIRFGVVSFETLYKLKIKGIKKGDQIKIALFNHQYDFLSQERRIDINLLSKNRESGLNNIFSTRISEMYNEILAFK